MAHSSRQAARRVVMDLVDGYNRKDVDAVAALYDPGITLWSGLGEEAVGREAMVEHLRHLFERLPDERMEVDALVTDGKTVVVEFTGRGTGPGGDYRIGFTEVLELSERGIAEIRTYIDPGDVESAAG